MIGRRSFFKSLASLVGGAIVSPPTIFIPKFEPVRWKLNAPEEVRSVVYDGIRAELNPIVGAPPPYEGYPMRSALGYTIGVWQCTGYKENGIYKVYKVKWEWTGDGHPTVPRPRCHSDCYEWTD